MSKIIFTAIAFLSLGAWAQVSSEVGVQEEDSSIKSVAQSGISNVKKLRLDLTLYHDQTKKKTYAQDTESVQNTYELFVRYQLDERNYLGATFSQVDGQDKVITRDGSRNTTPIEGALEPSIEWAYKTAGSLRYFVGAIYRFDMGAAKSTDRRSSPMYGGSALEPMVGLEVDFPGYLFGAELHYSLEGDRQVVMNDTKKIQTNGNRSIFYSYIEETSKYGPGVGVTYVRKEKTNYKDSSAEDDAFSKLSGEVYLQIPVQNDFTLIPLLSYTQVLETSINDVRTSRNDNYNFTIIGRAKF